MTLIDLFAIVTVGPVVAVPLLALLWPRKDKHGR